MKKKYKVLICTIAILFGFLSTSIGGSLIADSDLSFLMRFLFGFIFGMTPLTTIWAIIALCKKKKK